MAQRSVGIRLSKSARWSSSVPEDAEPFAEGKVDGGPLVQPMTRSNRSWPPAWAKDRYPSSSRNKVHLHRMLDKPAPLAVVGLGLKPVDEINDVIEPTMGVGSNAAAGNGDGQIGFASAGPADEHGSWATKPLPATSGTSIWLMGVPSNWKALRSSASDSMAMVSCI
jgi:hypothetical protein